MIHHSAHVTPVSGADAGQVPHVPGQDPAGSGMPRQVHRDDSAGSDPVEAAEDASAQREHPDQDGAPLGGSEDTEQQLTADTDVERDALKSLDPDDSPA